LVALSGAPDADQIDERAGATARTLAGEYGWGIASVARGLSSWGRQPSALVPDPGVAVRGHVE
jgi:hypothetical protein